MSKHTRRVHRSDRGAFLLIFALLLVFILTLVAFAVDLGQGRLQRRSNQQIADLASLAAGQYLAGYNGTDTVAADPFRACVAAFNSMQTNAEDFRPSVPQADIEAACSVFYDPTTDPITAACDPDNPPASSTPASLSRGPYVVTVRYPIPDSEIADSRFDSGVGANDGDDVCARMRVSVQRIDETAFASVIGVDEIRSEGSAVVKGSVDDGGKVVPAFLVLERFKCGALGNSVGGDSLGIVVESVPATATHPGQSGRIHVDSDASGNVPQDCANNTNNADGVTTWATPLPSGGSSLTLQALNASEPGVLSIVGVQPRAAGGGGINVEPTTGADVVSRTPVDDVFNHAGNDAIAAMHNTAHPQVTSGSNLGTGDNDWIEVDCDLVPVASDIGDVLEENWFVNCPAGFSPASPSAITSPGHGLNPPKQLVFSNSVSVPNGQTLDAAGVSKVVVRGSMSSSGSTLLPDAEEFYIGDGLTVTNNGSLSLNQDNKDLPSPDGDAVDTVCDEEDEHDEQNVMVVFFDGTGPSDRAMNIAGTTAMCETTVYLAGPQTKTTYTKQTDTTATTYGCEPEFPCPAATTAVSNARWQIAGLVEWTAPNRFHDGATDDDFKNPPPVDREREDLMFWSEAERLSDMSSGGILVSSGVFVSPNMRVEMRSPADAQPTNAQFIARQLFLFQGTLNLKPLPNDAIPIPEPGTYSLIR